MIDFETDILDEGINFVLLLRRVTTLEVIEDVEMLARGEQVKQNIVLRANTHELTDFVHLLK